MLRQKVPAMVVQRTGKRIIALATNGDFRAFLNGRYIDDYLLDRRRVEGVDVDDNTVPSSTWFNGRVGYNGETSGGAAWTVALNVQNLLDRTPPIVVSFS